MKSKLIKQTDSPLLLDLGCGKNKRQGFTGVDVIKFPGVDVVTDLTKLWPFPNLSVAEVHCSHLIEHLTAGERIHFVNELWRVMRQDAKCSLVAPHWSSCRAYGDPTHQWPPISEFYFFYLNRQWREQNAPHTDIANNPQGFDCNFDATWGYSLEPGVAMRNQEYQQYAMVYLKEACQDIICTLIKK